MPLLCSPFRSLMPFMIRPHPTTPNLPPLPRRAFLASLPSLGLGFAASCSSTAQTRTAIHPVALIPEQGQPDPLDDPAHGSDPAPLSAAIDRETLAAVPVSASQKVFDAYRPRGVSLWNLAWRDFDFTGVCWSGTRSGTVVGPRHVVCASHYPKNPGGAAYRPGATLNFTNPSGRPVIRTVVGAARATPDPASGQPSPDISCLLLDTPLPNTIRRYRVLPFAHPAALEGAHAVRTSYWGFKASLIRIHRGSPTDYTATLVFYQDPAEPAWKGPQLKVGDSGNPVLILAGGYPCIVATHSTPSAGPCFLCPSILETLRYTFQNLEQTSA
ncbi:MAG TPA: hypothetical protein VMN36_01240 [Verrucomicrobiales bacterium]|nr:hypothetical protein [Verrucomicrobiales bacterium]